MLPYISYCCAIWGNTHQSKLRKLFLLQKRALRLIANVSYTYHTDSLFKNYKCLKLEDLVKLHINCIMYKAFHSDLPVQLQKLFLKVENKHSYVTRRKDYFYQKSVRTKLKQMSISIFGVKEWNNLDTDTKMCKSISLFKKRLKRLFIENYK